MMNQVSRCGTFFIAMAICSLGLVIPATAQECMDCHTDVARQMGSGSHHVQGVRLSGKHCYACHWEARADGSINEKHHAAGKSSPVELVVWGAGNRPEIYAPLSSAVSFLPSDIGSPRERPEIAQISRHCLGCHSEKNNETRTFDGDSGTPRRYAWDGLSVDSRYSQKGVTTWGKYSTLKGNAKMKVTKAYSAHGNSARNEGGWSSAAGYDENIPVTRGGSYNVECFDCHNSHGSPVAGVTSSYRTADGTFNGAILKQTVAGRSGYRVSYTPSANPDRLSNNPYNSGAGICFDCHETAAPEGTPWGYATTFGATKPIMGYKDTLRFGSGFKGSTSRHTDRQGRSEIISSHLKAGRFLNYSTTGGINGLCTPCHDPHGVSPSLGDKMAYAVPLLKGTWLTSPYREDTPPSGLAAKGGFAKTDSSGNRKDAWEKGDFTFTNREANANFGVNSSGSPREPMAGMKYNIDRNTFGANRRISETDQEFGGLCLNCHRKEKFSGTAKADLIHRSVKGWGNNKEHSFPCAKCHQPHNSGLPRLMQTNCFQEGPSGLRENSGLPWVPDKMGEKGTVDKNSGSSGDQASGATTSKKTGKVEIVGCHVRQFGRGAGSKQESTPWTEKTKW